MRLISKALRDSAKGQLCTLRLLCCNHNPETTVLAHLRTGQSGMGMKSPDNMAVFACSACHTFIDSKYGWTVPAQDYLRALSETQSIWVSMGLITIKGVKT